MRFEVTYTDDVAIKTTSINNANITVTGPRNTLLSARLVSRRGSGKKVVAVYEIVKPRVAGTYNLWLNGSQILDLTGKTTARKKLGLFAVKA